MFETKEQETISNIQTPQEIFTSNSEGEYCDIEEKIEKIISGEIFNYDTQIDKKGVEHINRTQYHEIREHFPVMSELEEKLVFTSYQAYTMFIEKDEGEVRERLNIILENFEKFIINSNLGLIAYVVKTEAEDYEWDDCYQAGIEGIIKATRRFNLTKNARFATFALYYIRGEIQKEKRRQQTIRFATHLDVVLDKMEDIIIDEETKSKKNLSVNETRRLLVDEGYKREDIEYLFERRRFRDKQSLDNLTDKDTDNGTDTYELTKKPQEELLREKFVDHDYLYRAVHSSGLTTNQMIAYYLRKGLYDGEERKLREIADVLNCSTQYASDLDKKATAKVKETSLNGEQKDPKSPLQNHESVIAFLDKHFAKG